MSIVSQSKKWLTRIVVVLVLIIVFQNMDSAPIKLLFWAPEMSVALLLAIMALCGFIVGWTVKRRKATPEASPKAS